MCTEMVTLTHIIVTGRGGATDEDTGQTGLSSVLQNAIISPPSVHFALL